MRSSGIKIFFSASFQKKDMEVVKYFHSICKGLGLECVNVATAYKETPPEKARELITESDALIAVTTTRKETKNGKFNMPRAVDEEMSIAFGLEKPILPFLEAGIDVDEGFIKNYGTYKRFTRDTLTEHSVLEEIISAIEELKTKIVLSREPKLEQLGMGEYYNELTQMLISLEEENHEFTWDYSISKQLIFTAPFKRPIRAGVWPCVPTKNIPEAERIQWAQDVESGSQDFQLLPKIDKHTADSIELRLDIKPTPKVGDHILYNLHYRSKYLNPIYSDDIKSKGPFVVLNSNEYLCADGVVPIENTKSIKVQFRFPKAYELSPTNFAPIVGGVTTRVDSIIESEIERMQYEVDSFGGNIVIVLEITNPLLHHMYGMCWNPPKRKAE